MNDDDLLFLIDDLERWKHRELPKDWLANRKNVLIERLRRLGAEAERASGCAAPTPKLATPPHR